MAIGEKGSQTLSRCVALQIIQDRIALQIILLEVHRADLDEDQTSGSFSQSDPIDLTSYDLLPTGKDQKQAQTTRLASFGPVFVVLAQSVIPVAIRTCIYNNRLASIIIK